MSKETLIPADPVDIQKNKDVAAFSYIWVMSIVVYAFRKDSPFIRFHASQAVVLFLLSIPVYLLPYVGPYLVVLVLAGNVLGFINASQGKKEEIPIIAPLARGDITVYDLWSRLKPYLQRFVRAFRHSFGRPDKHVDPQPAAPNQATPTMDKTTQVQ